MPDLSFYTGAYTGQQIDQRLGKMIVVVTGTVTDQSRRITNSNILASHVPLKCALGNPAAQTANWTITTADGYLDISGGISGSTTVNIVLGLT